MRVWRKARRVIFRAARVKPKQRPNSEIVSRALTRIRATKEEAEAVIRFAQMAEKRGKDREDYGAKGSLSEDAYNIMLMERTEKVLGEKRAKKFFDMCNDPYF